MVTTFSVRKEFAIDNAIEWIQKITSNTSKLFTFLGRVTPWSIETSPDTPADTDKEIADSWSNMIALKRVSSANVSLAIRKIVWTIGQTYDQYDNTNPNLYESNYYVLASNNSVYKCLFNNNNNPSTNEPSSTSITPFSTTDGYKWQLMYTILEATLTEWQNDRAIPIKIITTDDSSDQWQVQSNAIPGTVDNIKIIDGGSGYLSAPSVVVNGDGQGATAQAVISGGAITQIIITNRGQDYTYATVTVSGNAILVPVVSPFSGHGSNAYLELNARYVIIKNVFADTESDVIPTNTTYRQIGLVTNPTLYGTNTVATDAGAINQSTTVDVTNASTFVIGETVQDDMTDATGIIAGYINNTLYLTNVKGAFQEGSSVVGLTSSTTSTIINVTHSHLQPFSGQLVYVENDQPIIRNPSQTETYRLVMAF